MQLYILPSQFPEFVDMSQNEVQRLYRIYYWKSLLHWGHWIGYGIFALFIFLWDGVAKLIEPMFRITTFDLVNVFLLIIFGGIGSVLYMVVVNQVIRFLYNRDKRKQN